MKQQFSFSGLYLNYLFWLLIISSFCFALERFYAWRKEQKWNREQFGQDIFFLIFNGEFAGLLIAKIAILINVKFLSYIDLSFIDRLAKIKLLEGRNIVVQIVIFFLLKDFVEWVTHRLLHRVPFLWKFHRLHHSIKTMDWAGNFRFHFGEIALYKTTGWLPALLLAPDYKILLPLAVVSTLIGHLNHSNLRTDWGIFRYIFNSPRLHIWHHDIKCHFPYGQNYAIIFSIWDWVFKTMYYPADVELPKKLGFHGIKDYPDGLFRRLINPIMPEAKTKLEN